MEAREGCMWRGAEAMKGPRQRERICLGASEPGHFWVLNARGGQAFLCSSDTGWAPCLGTWVFGLVSSYLCAKHCRQLKLFKGERVWTMSSYVPRSTMGSACLSWITEASNIWPSNHFISLMVRYTPSTPHGFTFLLLMSFSGNLISNF